MENLSKWENWDKLTVPTARFILEQAEKNLHEMSVAADVLTGRAVNILQFSIPLAVVLTGFLYTETAKSILVYAALTGLLFLLGISVLAFMVYNLYSLEPLGNSPEKMIIDEKVIHEQQELVFLFNAIKTAQISIRVNALKNEKRVKLIGITHTVIWIAMGSELIIFLFFRLFHP
jgi:hypothetical protein